MYADDVENYWKAITMIEAQNMLLQMTIADWPMLKKDARSKLHREMHKKATSGFPKKTITPEEFLKKGFE